MSRLIIRAGAAERHYWADLWRYRELFFFLSWRDILVRYKQTVIGVLWALIRPILTIAIFTLIFGKVAKLPSGGIPYPVFVCAGVLPWQFFATAMAEASNSLVLNANMLSKIYFPRLIVPSSAVIVAFVDLLISFVLLAALIVDLPLDFSSSQETPASMPPKDDFHLINRRVVGREFKGTEWEKQIVQHFGDTAVMDFQKIGRPTFFFIDGSHTYEYCKLDSEKCFVVCGGKGVFLWHDCDEWHPEVVRFVNEWRSAGRNIVRIKGTYLAYWKAQGSS